MSEHKPPFSSIILAGERPGDSLLTQAFSTPASVLVPVAGRPCLQYVMDAIRDSTQSQGGIICGPTAVVLEQSEVLQTLLHDPYFQWLEPASGPAASALLAHDHLNHYPTLLTVGDHALLTAEIVDNFCLQAQALASRGKHDFIIGFVPYALVKAAWPGSRRTVLKFSNGQFCGSNLFATLTPEGMKALCFWRQSEVDRKHPWRIARRFGLMGLLRYLCRRLSVENAMKALSKASGCSIGYVQIQFARAAVDVDSIEDQKLVENILSGVDRITRTDSV